MADSAPKIRKLVLRNFKGFREAELELSDFTVVVGANAAGKSNLRDAFRFLHGIGRGYTLPEVFGEKWIGGALQWAGIRGGVREAWFAGERTFSLQVETDAATSFEYLIEVGTVDQLQPVVVDERLKHRRHSLLKARMGTVHQDRSLPRLTRTPMPIRRRVPIAREFVSLLESVRFFDLSPDAMRIPSTPGQTRLGDRGENLSSVLSVICSEPPRKAALLEWIRQLTPMDVVDLDFESDAAGRVLVKLVEPAFHVTSALSASDGTLRFLALAAAFLTPDPAQLYFIEEIDSGLHPSRLHLLVELIESHTSVGVTQVVATTHSPQLLSLLSEPSLKAATLAYRVPESADQRLVRVMDLPDAARVLRKYDVARLHATGWLENAAAFAAAASESKAV
jgi:predicted ATPase